MSAIRQGLRRSGAPASHVKDSKPGSKELRPPKSPFLSSREQFPAKENRFGHSRGRTSSKPADVRGKFFERSATPINEGTRPRIGRPTGPDNFGKKASPLGRTQRFTQENDEFDEPATRGGSRGAQGRSSYWSSPRRAGSKYTEDKGRDSNNDAGLRMESLGDHDRSESFSVRKIESDRYDPEAIAMEKKERRRERVLEREYANPTSSKDFIQIERTTAASEFIYGRSAVLEALKFGTRQLYKLYLARAEDAKETEELYKHALNRSVIVAWVKNEATVAQMDKLAKGRPHNGVLLEASPLPKLPISALGPARKGKSFNVVLRHQSKEDAEVNGSDSVVPNEASFSRYPFVIMLDGIVDQGNLGGIIRSSYFLGVDAIVLSSHNAPLSTVALKAASGAAEGMKLLSVHNTTGFLQESKSNGWQVFAAVASPGTGSPKQSKHCDPMHLGQPLQDYPCILMLGSEGDGIRADQVFAADRTISIPSQRIRQSSVDSLNVGVAAGILMDAFLKKPSAEDSQKILGSMEATPLY